MMNWLKNNRKFGEITKLQSYLILILIMFLSVTGATYAYFAINATNNTISGKAATVNLTLDVTKVFPAADVANTGVLVPQLSTSGDANSPLSSALKNGCVDANQNVVCQVYKVNIQNIDGTATQIVDGSILFYSNPTLTVDVSTEIPNLKWKRINFADAITPNNSQLGTSADLVADANSDNIFIDDLVMATNSSFDYYLIIWVNETNNEQSTDIGKAFYGKVLFEASNGNGVTSTFTA